MPASPIEPTEPTSPGGTPVAGVTAVRRTPRYRAFALTGVILGVLGGSVVAALVGGGAAAAILVSAVACGLVGGWLGALVAVLLDRDRR